MINEFICHGRKVAKNHPKIKAIWSQGDSLHFNSLFESFWEIESITSHCFRENQPESSSTFSGTIFWKFVFFEIMKMLGSSFWCFKIWCKCESAFFKAINLSMGHVFRASKAILRNCFHENLGRLMVSHHPCQIPVGLHLPNEAPLPTHPGYQLQRKV